MDHARRNAILGLLACCMSAGCGLHTPVLRTGGTGLKGALLNYSCNAHPSDAIDPAKPTIVITHGWNPLPNLIQLSLGSAGAEAIKYRCGDTYNILSWDWNAVRVPPIPSKAISIGREQGLMLAAALRARGINPTRTQIISHSLGTIVAAQAAICLRDRGPLAQQTFLDPPKMFHRELFENLAATHYAFSVENYWAPGISGFGAPAEYNGVRSFAVEGTSPVLGIIDLSMSNHVNVMRWYHQTIVNPMLPYGFQTSILLGHCSVPGPLCLPAREGISLPILVDQ